MNRLSTEYERICYSMVRDFQVEMHRDGYIDNQYSFHYPSFGDKIESGKKILIYNRWNEVTWEPLFITSDLLSADIIEKARCISNPISKEQTTNPIKQYLEIIKSNRPFFYDVANGITQGILEVNIHDESWSDKIIFSNLLKIGKEAGPDQYEYQAQIEFSKFLFLLELEEIKPDIVLLITSLDYGEDFSSAIGLEPMENVEKGDFIIVQGDYKGAKVVLTRCPDTGDAEKCVSQVLDHLS